MSVRSGLVVMSAAVAGSSALQYALFFWVARYLGAEAYGAYSFALTAAVLTGPLGDLGISVSLVRTVSQRPAALPEALAAAIAWRVLLLLPVGIVAYWACASLGRIEESLPLLLPLCLATFCDGIGTLCSSAYQAQERMGASAAIQIGRNLVRGGALLVTLACGGGAVALAWAFFAASLLAALPGLVALLRRTRLVLRWKVLGPTLCQALPFGIAIIATILHGQLDVILLGRLGDAAEVGRYHASARFVVLAQMIPQVVAVATAPAAYRVGLEGGLPASARVYRLKATALALLGLLGTLLLVAHGEGLVHGVLGAEYRGSEVLVLALAPVIFVKFLSSSLVDTLGAIGRQGRLGAGCCLAVLLNVALNLAWLPGHGALGAVYATLASEAFLLAFLAASTLHAGIDLAWGSILGRPLVAACAAGLAAVVLGPAWALGAAGVALVALLVARPSAEERLLLGRPACR
jgi:O-antigen/teichoic acid export membrane protein